MHNVQVISTDGKMFVTQLNIKKIDTDCNNILRLYTEDNFQRLIINLDNVQAINISSRHELS